jgi:DNA-binding NtrC family response regulator
MFSESTVLLVGGDANYRNDIQRGLGDRFQLEVAESIDDALAHRSNSVEAVICDLDSQRVNGLELIQAWRGKNEVTPIIALSEGHDVAGIVEAMKQGASDCVTKPINGDQLRRTVERAIQDRHGAHRSGASSNSPPGNARPHIDIPPGTSLEDLERAAVEQALVEHQGNRTHAAKTLGISVRTLQRKLKAWGLPDPGFHHAGVESNFSNFMMQPTGLSHHAFSVHAH